MNFAAASDIGLVRETNQDRFHIPENTRMPLFMVADGMGGHNAGEIASVMAIDSIMEWMGENGDELTSIKKIQKSIVKSMQYTNRHIYNYAKDIDGCRGMGTTLTMGYVFGNKIIVGHVGDSRAYIIKDGKTSQITQDHSLVQELILEGRITEGEARSHPQKNIITRAVGTGYEIKVDTMVVSVEKNDIIVFCSDGLTNMISEEELAIIFCNESDIQKACDMAVDKARVKGGFDNITVLGIRF